MVVRKKNVIHPKNLWTSQNFPESNASAPARYFSLCRGYNCQFFFFMFLEKKWLYFFLLYRCFYLQWSNDSVSPVCRIFFIPYLRWKLVISYSYFSIGKITVLAFLHTLKIIHSWDKVVIKFSVSQPGSDFCHNNHRPTTPQHFSYDLTTYCCAIATSFTQKILTIGNIGVYEIQQQFTLI